MGDSASNSRRPRRAALGPLDRGDNGLWSLSAGSDDAQRLDD
jgi:hypothetical protein